MYQARNVSVETGIQKMFAIFGYKLCFAIHIVPALFPLVHYIFGQPTPDLWLTPHNIYDAWVNSRLKACFILTTGVGNDLSCPKVVALFGELLVVRECERNAHYGKFSGFQYSTYSMATDVRWVKPNVAIVAFMSWVISKRPLSASLRSVICLAKPFSEP